MERLVVLCCVSKYVIKIDEHAVERVPMAAATGLLRISDLGSIPF